MGLLLIVTFITLAIMVFLHFGLHSTQKWLENEMSDIRKRLHEDTAAVAERIKELEKKTLKIDMMTAPKMPSYTFVEPVNVKNPPTT